MKDLTCPACKGDGAVDGKRCAECQGEGCPLLTRCPYDEVPPDVWTFVDLCDDAEKGLLPLAGGVLDQATAFNQGRRIVRNDKAYFRAQLRIPPTE
jgi:RecJ-like exonuclease